jgi:thiol-disulfide isomerase/thioredoxin
MPMLRALFALVLAATVVVAPRPTQAQDAPASGDVPEIRLVDHAAIFEAIEARGAEVTVVNFWATWCVPCIEEFPYFMRLKDAYAERGVEVMFVSADFPEEKAAAARFLAEQGVAGPSFLKNEKTTPFVNAFHEDWSGALPATFVYDAEGSLVDFWEGKTTYDDLERRVLAAMRGE